MEEEEEEEEAAAVLPDPDAAPGVPGTDDEAAPCASPPGATPGIVDRGSFETPMRSAVVVAVAIWSCSTHAMKSRDGTARAAVRITCAMASVGRVKEGPAVTWSCHISLGGGMQDANEQAGGSAGVGDEEPEAAEGEPSPASVTRSPPR